MTRLNGRGLHIKTKRMDPRAREPRYEVFFPHDVDPPFLVSHVSTGPGPQDFTHPKGIGPPSPASPIRCPCTSGTPSEG